MIKVEKLSYTIKTYYPKYFLSIKNTIMIIMLDLINTYNVLKLSDHLLNASTRKT